MTWILSVLKGFGLKIYAFAASIAVVVGLILRNRWLVRDRNEEEARRKRAEAILKRDSDIDASDAEISNEFSDRRRDDSKDNLRDSNKW